MFSPVSLVIGNINMEYFEELALDPQCSIAIPWLKRYEDEIISTGKKEQVDTLFNHSNSVDPHI